MPALDTVHTIKQIRSEYSVVFFVGQSSSERAAGFRHNLNVKLEDDFESPSASDSVCFFCLLEDTSESFNLMSFTNNVIQYERRLVRRIWAGPFHLSIDSNHMSN